MLESLLKEEAAVKADAERAAAAGDWARVKEDARRLVGIYGAILGSGLSGASTASRWETLRRKWTDIAEQAGKKSRNGSVVKAIATGGAAAGARDSDNISENGAISGRKSHVSEGLDSRGGGAIGADAAKGSPREGAVATGVRLSDVKGLDNAKQAVMDALVNPVRHPDIYKTLKIRNGKGLLLYGPPGTGKTMFARAVAGELALPFIYRKMSDMKDKYVGESEKNVARLFEEANRHKKCVIFLDECESILRKRGNQKICIVEQFLAELDGFATRRDSQVFVILATNRPWLIDSAVVRSGRIGLAVHVGLPDAETRRVIIESALKDIPLADDVSLDELVERTEGYSGAELHHGDGGGVCDEAANRAGRRWVARREGLTPEDPEWKRVEPITKDDFDAAIKAIAPVSRKDPEIIRRNLDFSIGGQSSPGGEDDE